MPGLSAHMVLPMEFFEDAAQVLDLPRGVLLSLALNPYNGNIIVSYQDNASARFFARLAVDQLAGYPDMFSPDLRFDGEQAEFLLPECEVM